MDPLHLPVGGLPFLLHLPQAEQQRLHYDVYIKQNKNGKSCRNSDRDAHCDLQNLLQQLPPLLQNTLETLSAMQYTQYA